MGETGVPSSQVSEYNPHEQNARYFDAGLQVVPHTTGAGAGNDPEVPVPKLENQTIPVQDPEKLEISNGDTSHKSSKVYNISRRTFWIGAILLILVVTGIAVGAGVGASKHSTSSATSTAPTISSPQPSSTTISSAAPSSTSTSAGCSNGTTYVTSVGVHFREVCNNDFIVGSEYNTTAADITSVAYVSTFEGCMDACGLFWTAGIIYTGVQGSCRSVSWISDERGFGTCFLKNATALIGSSNATAQMLHAKLNPGLGRQSASMVDDYGNIL